MIIARFMVPLSLQIHANRGHANHQNSRKPFFFEYVTHPLHPPPVDCLAGHQATHMAGGISSSHKPFTPYYTT